MTSKLYTISDEFKRVNIFEQFISVVKKYPDKIAVTDEQTQLTFDELLRLAQYNAQNLRSLGIKPGEYILVSVDRSVALSLSWVISMSLGAIFIPVDLKWPEERLNCIVKQTNAKIHLKLNNDKDLCFEGLLNIPIQVELSKNTPGTSCMVYSPITTNNSILYGFFTSGTTGNPKCALNYHEGVYNRLKYMTKYFGSGHVVMQNSAHVFDSSVWQILWPLVSGGTTVIPLERKPTDIIYTTNLIERCRVTMTDFVPSIFDLLVRELKKGRVTPEKLSSMKNIIVGGEQINTQFVRDFQAIVPEVNLVNTYGHTEASIGMVFHKIENPVGDHIPLGSPIDNTFVKICDDNLKPCRKGDSGEIIVGGICLGGGYLGLPEQTKKIFVDNPFQDIPCKTVYRTGDLGKINEQGLLEYIGRKDSEVKIRGVRINLSEIEHIVESSFDHQIQAVALSYQQKSGDRVIGLVYTSSTHINSNLIINHLIKVLPASHLPKKIIHFDEIPLTPSGKVDRCKLEKNFINSMSITKKRTMLKEIIEAFKLFLPNEVKIDTDFFESGGDSMDAVNLSLDLEEKFSLQISPSEIYQNPTPLLLSKWLEFGANENDTNQETKLPLYTGPEFTKVVPGKIKHILLTGATGFVGIHLLAKLLCETEAVISIIVRSENVEQAVDRMHSVAADAEINLSRWVHRIQILPGDLSMPKLGCNALRWEWLIHEIDTVIHAGADVNFMLTYKQLYNTNVGSTEQLVQLCSLGRAKRMYYISSFAARHGDVLLKDKSSNSITVEELTACGANGYATTKIASEQLLFSAASLGLEVGVFRLDDVLPSLFSGVANKRSVIYRFFRLCYSLRVAPTNIGGIAALTVDKAVLSLTRTMIKSAATSISNKEMIVNDVTSNQIVDISRLFSSLEEVTECKFGYVTYHDFLKILTTSSDPAVRMMLPLLPSHTTINSIFGPSINDIDAIWHGNYSTLAAAFAHYRFYYKEQEIIYGTIASATY